MEGVEIGNISIPLIKGEKGDTGQAGTIVSISVTMLSSTATPYANNTGTPENAVIELGIPVGTGIASATINEDGELVLTLSDNTQLNLGVIMPNSIVNVSLNENFDFIVTLTDGTQTVVGNISTQIASQINTALANYYDKDTADSLFALIDETGNKIDLSINSTTYVMTLNLKDKNNNILSTGTIDLPLETMVVNARYDNTTKEIVLTLQNGNTVRFSVADLVSGLVSESTFNSTIQQINTTLGNKANTSDIPTKTSDLTNDSDFTTKAYVDDLVGDIETLLYNINRGSGVE